MDDEGGTMTTDQIAKIRAGLELVDRADLSRLGRRIYEEALTAFDSLSAPDAKEGQVDCEALAVAVGEYVENHFARGGGPGYLRVPDFIRSWRPAAPAPEPLVTITNPVTGLREIRRNPEYSASEPEGEEPLELGEPDRIDSMDNPAWMRAEIQRLRARLSPPSPKESHICAICSTTPDLADERMICKQCVDAFFADSAPREVPMAPCLKLMRKYWPMADDAQRVKVIREAFAEAGYTVKE